MPTTTHRGRHREYTDEQLLRRLCAVAQKLQRWPSAREFDSVSKRPRTGCLILRFGTWNGAIERAKRFQRERPATS